MQGGDPEAALDALAAGALRERPDRAQASFEAAWPSLERRLGTFLRSLGVPRRLWDDCGQAALLRVWKARRRYRGTTRAELMAWMYRICQREHLRRFERDRLAPEPSDAATLDAPREDGPFDRAAARDTRSALDECLAALERSQRQVVELLYSTSAPTERQVATMIDVSKSHVNQLRRTALAALARCLRSKGEVP